MKIEIFPAFSFKNISRFLLFGGRLVELLKPKSVLPYPRPVANPHLNYCDSLTGSAVYSCSIRCCDGLTADIGVRARSDPDSSVG